MDNDIELDISPGGQPGRYQVRVVHSPAGGDQREEFDLDVEGLLRSRPQLEASILSSVVGARRTTATAEKPVREVGKHLFETLFVRSVYGAYRASLGVAQQQGGRLRVVLRFGDPALSALPWEALFDPERQAYVCRQEPMVRRVPAQYNPRAALEVTPPLAVLAIVASPRGLVPLDTERERANLEEALGDLIDEQLVEITWVEQATWRAVHSKLLSGRWHVVHFIGHGDFDTVRQEGVLAFVGRDGRPDFIEADRFADLLGEAEPTPRLVVLNACSTGEGGSDDMFSAVAPALVHSGIEAVAAMQFAISDDAAITFAQGFYTAVAHSRGVDEAARSGRIAILGEAGSLEWLTPVLYLRGDSTHPIVMRPKPVAQPGIDPPVEPPPVETEAPVSAEAEPYDRAVAALEEGDFAQAVALFDTVHELNPRFRDVVSLREQARRGQESEELYQEAKTASDEGRYAVAVRMFDVLLNAEPDFRDAAELRAEARSRELERTQARTQRATEPEVPQQRTEASPMPPPRRPRPPRGPGAVRRLWRRRPRRRALLLGAAAIAVVLVAGVAVVVLKNNAGSRLDDDTVLVAISKTGLPSRLEALDIGTGKMVPFAGSADDLPTASGGVSRFAATPSPDRTKVAYLEGVSGRAPVPYVADARGRQAHKLMRSPDSPCQHTKRPAWSADGNRLAVVCIFPSLRKCPDGAKCPQASWSLSIVNAENGARIRSVMARQDTLNLGAPTWDSAGHKIYVSTTRSSNNSELGFQGEVASVPDNSPHNAVPHGVVRAPGGNYQEPDWSPAGLLLVDKLKEILVLAKGGGVQRFTGDYQNAAWAPDRGSIIATQGSGPDLELVTIDYPSRTIHQTHVTDRFGAPVWDTR